MPCQLRGVGGEDKVLKIESIIDYELLDCPKDNLPTGLAPLKLFDGE
ncbi:MAG: hypothetical protein IPH34_13230 [Chitinophagaceae bacterium]|nr:hypothetical protein [Chitinophagaceae bacterium]MBK8312395.1 hypothetical protein [Chitinophagaceae bacterium]MBK8606197.1 hypothetical protein [Chitinophagaceae bacterium]